MAKEYIFRIKPQGYKNNYRVIRIGGGRTLDELHERFCSLFGESCSRQELEDLFPVLEFGGMLSGYEKDGAVYLSCLEDQGDISCVLKRREQLGALDYYSKSRQELEDYRANGIVPPSMLELMDYLIMEKQMEIPDCMRLEELVQAGADLVLAFPDIEDEIREILNENNMRLTKRVREMMSRAMKELPSASLKVYSMVEFRAAGKNAR